MLLANRKYGLLAYALFKGLVKYIMPLFAGSKLTIQRAQLRMGLDEYAAAFILTAVMASPLAAILLALYLVTFTSLGIVEVAVISLVVGLFIAMAVMVVYLVYPEYRVNSLKSELDKHVAFAATHMATIAGTGVPPHIVFHMMSEFKEYGDVAATCGRIARNISVFGYDTVSAISEEAQVTPSHKFKDLLWSIVAVVRTGGDMREMLIVKSKSLMEDQRRTEAKYIETLSMYAEIYSTVFVAGVVMIFVLVAIMGILGGLPVPVKLLLQVTTYLGVPLGSIAFIFLIETSKPMGA